MFNTYGSYTLHRTGARSGTGNDAFIVHTTQGQEQR